MNEIVSIDLGSNSFRVLKYDCLNSKIIGDYHEIVGLADGLVNSGKISLESQNRVISAIFNSIKKLDYNPSNVFAVTTAAMRKAKNSEEVLKSIKDKTNISFKIIDGKEEARLTLLAVQYALYREKIKTSKFILLDIGGGSTEIIVNNNQGFHTKSFDFGIVTMSQKYNNTHDLLEELKGQKIRIKSFLDTLNINLNDYLFVATAGTPTTIAAVKLGQDYFNYDKNIVNGTIVNLNDLIDCLNILKSSTNAEIIKLVGRGRVEFVEVGIYIYRAIFEVLNKQESIVLDDGLREGVAINECIKCKDLR